MHNTTQHNTTQHNTTQHNTTQHNTTQHNTTQVTFIIPVYNSARYLRECLDSVLRQSVSKEIIIIDDGSSDSSLSIILEYQEKYPEILLIRQSNQGAAVAKNKGIALATGDYISFIDSDDFIINDISDVIAFGKLHSCNLIKFGSVWQHYDEQRDHKYYLISYLFSDTYDDKASLLSGYNALCDIEKRKYWIPGVCWTLIERKYLEKHRIRFYENIIAEDQLFYLQLLTKSADCKIIEIPSVHYAYRRNHHHSVSNRIDEKYIIDHFRMIRLILDYMVTLPNELHSAFLFIIRNLFQTVTNVLQKMNAAQISNIKEIYEREWSSFVHRHYADLALKFSSIFDNN